MKFMKTFKKMLLFLLMAVVFFFAKGFAIAVVCLVIAFILFLITAFQWVKWIFNF